MNINESKVEIILYRTQRDEKLAEISQLMAAVFDEFIAPGYDPQGIEVFSEYIQPQAIGDRLKRNHFLLVAILNQKIIGVLEMRNHNHLSLLFVTKSQQRQGIAKKLVQQATNYCLREEPDLTKLTVHSDPKAVPAYAAMGFTVTGSERVEDGIRYIPMTRKIQ
ncbi:MAG: GNAT family N-acetyltransferase [Limnothrix sp.]